VGSLTRSIGEAEPALLDLCEARFNSDETDPRIARGVLGAPDLEISEGGEAMPEQVAEIAAADRQGATEH
jgi:hypothetical protein